MVVELEKAGFPTVHVANMTPVSVSLGCNRILRSYGIPYPYCDPTQPEDVQAEQRYDMLIKALEVLSTDVEGPTVFEH